MLNLFTLNDLADFVFVAAISVLLGILLLGSFPLLPLQLSLLLSKCRSSRLRVFLGILLLVLWVLSCSTLSCQLGFALLLSQQFILNPLFLSELGQELVVALSDQVEAARFAVLLEETLHL